MCIALLAVGIAMFSFSACTNASAQAGRANTAQVERWEYRMVRAGCCCFMDNMINELNQLGQEGWKLVSIARVQPNVSDVRGILKRRLP